MARLIGNAASLALAGFLVVAVAAAAQAEIMLKAVSGFSKTNARTKSYMTFIDKVNATGKGVIQVRLIGGPEIAHPSKQPIALRNGLFDLLYSPPAYYLGLFPEGDALEGFKTAAESRRLGGFDLLDKPMRKRLGATFLARPDVGIGLYLFLKDKPKLTPSGQIDLSGLKIRGSASYRDFIIALGGTPVILRGGEIYTALERGVVDGAGTGLTSVRDNGLQKFLKYRIEPNFVIGSVILIGNAKKIDGLPAKARKILHEAAVWWEKASMAKVGDQEAAEKKILAKLGQQPFRLKGKAAKEYVEIYTSKPWKRLRTDPKVMIDYEKARRAFY